MTALFVVMVAAVYCAFFVPALQAFQESALSAGHLKNLSMFYLRICGLFFILIEGSIAWLLFKSYRLLKTFCCGRS